MVPGRGAVAAVQPDRGVLGLGAAAHVRARQGRLRRAGGVERLGLDAGLVGVDVALGADVAAPVDLAGVGQDEPGPVGAVEEVAAERGEDLSGTRLVCGGNSRVDGGGGADDGLHDVEPSAARVVHEHLQRSGCVHVGGRGDPVAAVLVLKVEHGADAAVALRVDHEALVALSSHTDADRAGAGVGRLLDADVHEEVELLGGVLDVDP